MKKIKRGSSILVIGLCFAMSAFYDNYTYDMNMRNMGYVYQENSDTVVPYADVIRVKYRVYNGKTQYRRWNETRKKWVDPFWIDFE